MRNKKVSLYLITLALIVLVTAIIPYAKTVKITQTTTMYIDPSAIIDPTLTPCNSFIVTIIVSDVVDLQNWQVRLDFDPSILNITDPKNDIFLPPDHVFSGPEYYPFFFSPVVYNPDTTSSLGASLLWGVQDLNAAGFTGSGKLCSIRFHIIGTGATPLELRLNPPGNCFLEDVEGTEIPFTTEDGYFDNRLPPSEATLYVDPPKIIDPTLLPCQNFTIDIKIDDADRLYYLEFKLNFDPSVLNATDAMVGDFIPPEATSEIELNNTEGYVWFIISLDPLETSLQGNGTVANVTFHVINLGVTNISFSDVYLADSSNEPLPFITLDGYFNNMLIGKLAVQPKEIIDPSLTPPKTFEINITIDDVESLYGYEFTLSFNPAILACISITFLDALNETNYIPQVNWNNSIGNVWIEVDYYPPAEPLIIYDPVAFVTIKFRVKTFGATILDLHDTSLIDAEGEPITHEVEDGLFANIIRDVAVLDVEPEIYEAYQGWIVYINVTVVNEGEVNETFEVTAYYDSNSIGTISVVDLKPGENITITFAWDTQDATPCFNYTIKVEAHPVPFELDTSDNTYVNGEVRIKFMGDADGNGFVDGADLGIVGRAFGSYPSHPERWDERADMNQDNFVDGRDLGLVGRNYGKGC